MVPKPGGCNKCRGTGMKGRLGIFEIFQVTDDVRGLINSNLTSAQLRKRARELGMRTLREDGIRKVMAGLTSADLATARFRRAQSWILSGRVRPAQVRKSVML